MKRPSRKLKIDTMLQEVFLLGLACDILNDCISPWREDWPKSTPKSVIERIEKQNSIEKKWSYRIKIVTDELKKNRLKGKRK